MLDIRKPLGLLFILLGVILFAYGMFIQKEVMFHTPQTKFPLKLNMPVGLFMFAFGMVMWQLSRYVNIIRLERGLKEREKELEGRPSTEPLVAEASEATKDGKSEGVSALEDENTEEVKSENADVAKSENAKSDNAKSDNAVESSEGEQSKDVAGETEGEKS